MPRALVSIVIAVFMLASCGREDGNSRQIYGHEVDSVVVDSTMRLVDSEYSPNCQLHIALRYFPDEQKLNDSILATGLILPEYLPEGNRKGGMRQLVDEVAKNCITSYRQQYASLFKLDKSNADEYNIIYKVYTKTWSGPDSTVCYEAHIISGNKNHQQLQTIARNFKLKTGSTVALNEIFVPGYENVLIRLVVDKLKDKFDVKDEDQLKTQRIFADCDPYLPDNFMLLKNKLIFIYNQDEIAPHDEGEIRVELSKHELKDLLKQR